MELYEFDYELVAQKVSSQVLALEQSNKKKLEQDEIYTTTLEEYREKKKALSAANDQRQNLYWKFSEKLNVKNSFNELQTIPNSKVNSLHDETLALYDRMGTESDEYVNDINTILSKIQNLGTEFDTSVISNSKSEIANKTEIAANELKIGREKYEFRKLNKMECEFKDEIASLRKLLKDSEFDEIDTDIGKIGQDLALVNNNIDFLKEKNWEFKVQLGRLEN